MKIAIELHGSTSHGPWSPTRGEGRWAQNVAAVLATMGHDVYLFGTSGEWGTCPRIQNLIVCHYDDVIGLADVDVLFDAAMWVGKPLLVKSRVVLRGYFSFGQEYFTEPWPENHWFLCPYPWVMAAADVPANPVRDRTALLPYVLPPRDWWPRRENDWSPKSSAKRGAALLPTRESFCTPIVAAYADALLDHLRRAAVDVAVLHRHKYAEAGRLEAIDGFDVYESLPCGQLLDLLSETKLVCNLPVWGGVAMEAPLHGACPLAWSDQPVFAEVTAGIDPSLVLPADRSDVPAMISAITRLWADDDLRDRLMAAYREALRFATVDAFKDQWRALEKRL